MSEDKAIKNCIKWNESKARGAKEVRDRDRYLNNVKNLKALLDD